ncbi:MAG: hypothetical protein GWN31_08905, partial [Candidatus Thorarchaeota archaeon]|nr:hypothetical protein [Candidatus Thorarchaeota archaeon]NIW14034.1 hypothetical protein [Candidatus Thorarchaeota archaeon]NIW52131.1 hypothetical protein [Candidatus Korarchaeota archaeon]
IMPVNDKLAIMGVWFLLLLIIGGTIGVPNIPKVFMWVVGGISVGTLAWSLKISIVGR